MKNLSFSIEKITEIFNYNLLFSGLLGSFSIYIINTILNSESIIKNITDALIEVVNSVVVLNYPIVIVILVLFIVTGLLMEIFMKSCSIIVLLFDWLFEKNSYYRNWKNKLFPLNERLLKY